MRPDSTATACSNAPGDPAIKAKLAANTEAAVERGAFGIPIFFVGKKMFFGKDRLGQLEEEIVKAA